MGEHKKTVGSSGGANGFSRIYTIQTSEAQIARLPQNIQQYIRELAAENERLKRQNKKFKDVSTIDELTQVANVRALNETIDKAAARLKRYERAQSEDKQPKPIPPVTFLFFDFDKFKQVNTLFGDQGGDAALKHAAKIISRNLRKEDFFARKGGDEFVAVLDNTTEDQAQAVLDKVRNALAKTECKYRGKVIPISISCGFHQLSPSDLVDEKGQELDKKEIRKSILAKADAGMKQDKKRPERTAFAERLDAQSTGRSHTERAIALKAKRNDDTGPTV